MQVSNENISVSLGLLLEKVGKTNVIKTIQTTLTDQESNEETFYAFPVSLQSQVQRVAMACLSKNNNFNNI